MTAQFSSHTYNITLKIILFFNVCFVFKTQAQTQATNNASICKELAIESAQLAHQGYLYSRQSYFINNVVISNLYIDSAKLYLNEAIVVMDSAIVLTPDSNINALKYAELSKGFAHKAINVLMLSKNETVFTQKKQLQKKTTYHAEDATVEAYHASFYFIDKNKINTPKVPEAKPDTVVKQITKLDIDQTLFTLLQEELKEKTTKNANEIAKVAEEIIDAKDPAKQAKLKSQLKKLENTQKSLQQKTGDATVKLTDINQQIEVRDKAKVVAPVKEETVFAKSTTLKANEEWNKQIKIDEELPKGLVYQVQLGVYKSEVLPNSFKGLTPIYAKTTEKGVCYSTGIFEKLADAKEAKSYVVAMGLTDAFVVAYYNKKKITIAEAAKLEKK